MAKIKLSAIDTRAPKKMSKENIKKETQKLKFKIEELQNLMYAEGKHALLSFCKAWMHRAKMVR
jgi:hypothetical protein